MYESAILLFTPHVNISFFCASRIWLKASEFHPPKNEHYTIDFKWLLLEDGRDDRKCLKSTTSTTLNKCELLFVGYFER